jgi:choline dehydrogenase-like flavoprotein
MAAKDYDVLIIGSGASGGMKHLDFSMGGTPDGKFFPLYGEALQEAVDDSRGRGFSTTLMGEVLPRFENHVSIDKNVVDAWGIPALHFQCRYSDNEFNMAKDAIAIQKELCHALGWEVLSRNDQMFPPRYSRCVREMFRTGMCRTGNV